MKQDLTPKSHKILDPKILDPKILTPKSVASPGHCRAGEAPRESEIAYPAG